MRRDARYTAGRAFMLLGLAVFAVSARLAVQGREPFATWFYLFAWWSYIFFVDGWVYRMKGESLILTHPRRFLFLAAWSAFFWFFYEALNLRLQNWAYVDLPPAAPLRWAGYFLAFATVVPALLETADLVDAGGMFREGRVRSLGWKKRVEPQFVAAGALMLLLPMALPKYFFPLVWGAPLFLLEPVNERWGAFSMLSEWRMGRVRHLLILAVAGFLCGGLWECWNALSRARWVYDIPFVGGAKIFEMPALGYLGFPVFAASAFVSTVFALSLWQKSSRGARLLYGAGALALSLAVCAAMDARTVRSFQP